MSDARGCFTVWQFRGVSIPQTTVVVRASEPFEPEHEYQRILWRGLAWGKMDALNLAKMAGSVQQEAECAD